MAIPEMEMVRVTKRLDAYCARLSARPGGAGRYGWRVRGNHVSLSERRPDWNGLPGEVTVHEFARLRYDPATDDWTLGWRDAKRRLHTYEGSEETRSFEGLIDMLEAAPVRSDPAA